ncbi:hypothetical protein HanPI659440_Chr03g0093741 [Helianthus annuus]|nr:hypothetical protein HanPI659440_Chr03g0093741 [Helianthus annuus]
MNQPRLTGSKLETPMIAPKIPPRTIPPAPMLSKKLFSDGVTPDAACATSGTTMDAVRTAAVNAVTAFSFIELFTTTKRCLDAAAGVVVLELSLRVNGLKKEAVGGRVLFLWVNGIAMERAQVEAIDDRTAWVDACLLVCDG